VHEEFNVDFIILFIFFEDVFGMIREFQTIFIDKVCFDFFMFIDLDWVPNPLSVVFRYEELKLILILDFFV